ncbi:MAG: DNA-binding protein [Nitrososphaerota archaeon]|jgi:replication factor A1|nr:DNA-binding protein [Nitrososphaerota archaeon]MDG7039397.1 DNA-binding protein [Nitrososphaerota archaeon]MDG7040440.1 DNA-binding protein [Nitrososphaerota archaeon]MDG7043266.1 DNA-binding protein [Nitrososphaerota archaeon]MDG7044445.1 DNA-binding protein [Nitrososphaerota archaeon]
MNIKELYDGQRAVSVEGVIAKKGEPREVRLQRTGETALVADCLLKDSSGTITLTLWNEGIEQVKEGDSVKIENGYTNSFRGELRLNVGRYGKLTVVSTEL